VHDGPQENVGDWLFDGEWLWCVHQELHARSMQAIYVLAVHVCRIGCIKASTWQGAAVSLLTTSRCEKELATANCTVPTPRLVLKRLFIYEFGWVSGWRLADASCNRSATLACRCLVLVMHACSTVQW
jgi:hypothetical protein